MVLSLFFLTELKKALMESKVSGQVARSHLQALTWEFFRILPPSLLQGRRQMNQS
jgi:hypothetical protein